MTERRRHWLFAGAACAILVLAAAAGCYFGRDARTPIVTLTDVSLMMPDATATQSLDEIRSTGFKPRPDLSFELFENGRMIFIDSGMYSYTIDEMRAYVAGPGAHNTISLGDVEIRRKSLDLAGSELDCLRPGMPGSRSAGM